MTSQYKVLVADDDRDAADSLAALIGALGYPAEVAYDGASALKACERSMPELAILDIQMPCVDGCEAARRLRGFAHPPKSIASFSGMAHEGESANGSPFDVKLSKPPRLGELRALLARACADD